MDSGFFVMRYMYDIVMLSQKNPNMNLKVVRDLTKILFTVNIELNNFFNMLSFIFKRVLVQEAIPERKSMRFENCGQNFSL